MMVAGPVSGNVELQLDSGTETPASIRSNWHPGRFFFFFFWLFQEVGSFCFVFVFQLLLVC